MERQKRASRMGVAEKALLIVALFVGCSLANSMDLDLDLDLEGRYCSGSVAECYEEEEQLMDSIINRRVLATSTSSYISYQSLSADKVSCPAGYSYYNGKCKSSSGAADPTVRSCSTATRCQRDTSSK